ncbi:MAG: alpha/beta hydrolase [Bryobacteraceae bacterium]
MIRIAICLTLVSLASRLLGQEVQPEWTVLYGLEEFRNAESALREYLGKIRSSAEADREKAIAAVRTSAEVSKYQGEARARLATILGDFPPRTPLNPKVTGRLDRVDYVVENVIFESRPRYYVTANAYVPRRGRAPFPGVLAPVGHWGAGKFFEDYQRLGAYLAQRGFLVLVYDAPGQGERQQYYDHVMGQTLLSPGNTQWFVTIEHGYAGGQTILTRDNYASYMLWDGIRAIDYLAERSDVDRERIACTGTSGGGLQTELLSAIDPRIKVAIPVCYGGCAPDTPSRKGIGRADIDALIAPRPLLMIEATGDPRAGVLAKQKRHEIVSHLYDVSQMKERTRFVITEEPHGYGETIRRAAYEWLSRWLNGTTPAADTLKEERWPLEPEEALRCTTTGQVRTALAGETVFTLNRAEASRVQDREPLPRRREDWAEWGRRLREDVRSRIALEPSPAVVNARQLGRIDRGTYVLEKAVYFSDPEVFVPALLFLPKMAGRRPAVILANEGGKTAGGVIEKYVQPLVEGGIVVLSIDPRGTGETAPVASRERNYRGFIQDNESSLMYEALGVGLTLLGLRTRDVQRAADYLEARPEVDPSRISAIGHGSGGLLVLHAAALDERIRSVACMGTLMSYASVVENEIYGQRISLFPRAGLRKYDLPELAALIAPRPLLLLNGADQVHRPVELERAAKIYSATSGVYELVGAKQSFQIDEAAFAEAILGHYRKHLAK